jgi:hypothetical protein
MPKPIQFKTLLLLMLLFSSSTNVFSQRQEKDNQENNRRYIDHGNGTVTDTKTALMWKQCPEGLGGGGCTTNTGEKRTYTWKEAILLTNGYSFANHDDWRLPNIKELLSLVTRNHIDAGIINRKFFPNTSNGRFWSSSPYINNNSYTWVLEFLRGTVIYNKRDAANLEVRLVRGGE